ADRISEAAVLAKFLKQPRRHAAADRLDEDGKCRDSRVRGGKAWEAKAPVRLLELAAVVAHSASELRPADRDAGPIFHVAEQPLGELQQFIGLDPPARRKDQARGHELIADPGAAILR